MKKCELEHVNNWASKVKEMLNNLVQGLIMLW